MLPALTLWEVTYEIPTRHSVRLRRAAHGVVAGQISDSVLAERVAEIVRQYVHFGIFDDINIQVDNRSVILTGRVTMPYKRDEIAARVKKIDGVVGENGDKKMAAFVTVLTENPDKDEAKLKEIAKKEGLKNIPLTVFDGVAGPEDYKIAEKADVTVMMWVGSNVKVNHAFAKGELKADATKAIVADTKKILN